MNTPTLTKLSFEPEQITDDRGCHCTHLTDFASEAEEWLPPIALPNPFDAGLIDAFLADPRNLVIAMIILSMYIFWVYACIEGYGMDKRERHQNYMSVVSAKHSL